MKTALDYKLLYSHEALPGPLCVQSTEIRFLDEGKIDKKKDLLSDILKH